MPGIHYLDNEPGSPYAPHLGLGEAFSNAAIYNTQQRIAQQRFLAQQALEQQRINMEKERLMTELPGIRARGEGEMLANDLARQTTANAARIGRLSSQSRLPESVLGQQIRDPDTMAQLATDLRASGAAPQGAFEMRAPAGGIPPELLPQIQAAVRGSLMGTVGSNPAAAERALQPIVGAGYRQIDPTTGQMVMDAQPRARTEHERALEAIAAITASRNAVRDQQRHQDTVNTAIARAVAQVMKSNKYGDVPDDDTIDQIEQRIRRIFGASTGQPTDASGAETANQALRQFKSPDDPEYQKLQPGQLYIGPDGKPAKKRGKAAPQFSDMDFTRPGQNNYVDQPQ